MVKPNRPPSTFYVDPEFAMRELDFADMIALSGVFRRWALYEPDLDPAYCTKLICWSADYERLAQWVGPSWEASSPTGSLAAFLAGLERRSSTVIDARCVFELQRKLSGND
jgi:hypothetical protein